MSERCAHALVSFPTLRDDPSYRWFQEFEAEDFAKQGYEPSMDLRLEKGPLSQFPVTMLSTLRKLGMPVAVNSAQLHLLDEFVVCARAVPLTAEQAKILVMDACLSCFLQP